MRPSVRSQVLVGTLWVAALSMGAGVSGAADVEVKGSPADLQKYLQPLRRTVTLTGRAKQTVQSDVGHVSVVIKTQAKDLPAALRANADRRAALARTLIQQGIGEKAIRAERFSSSPQFGWFGKNPASYEVTNRLIVDVSDDVQLTRVSEAAAQSTETSIGSIDFEYSKQNELQEATRHQAFEDALAKKGYYEQKLGVTLKPVSFQFSDRTARGAQTGLELQEVIVAGASRRNIVSESPAAPPIASFDEARYEVSVDVTFEAESGKN